MHVVSLLAWMILGGVVGFICGRLSIKGRFRRALDILQSVSIEERTKRNAIADIGGMRSGVVRAATVTGVFLGALVWGVLSLLVWAFS